MKEMFRKTAYMTFALTGCFLLVVILTSCRKTPAEEGSGLRVNAFPENGDTLITCNEIGEKEFYVFLPSGADRSALYLEYGFPSLTVNGVSVLNSSVTDVFASGTDFLMDIGGEEDVSLHILQSDGVPAVFITTADGGLDYLHSAKENKLGGTAAVVENGEITVNGELKYIKGRGNSTWNTESEKKPYNIKFDDSVSLLGMSKAKKWRLLANDMDTTLIKNTAALKLAEELGVYSAIECRPVDLYINGDYRGNYLLTESIDAGKGRVEIGDTEKLNEEANEGAALDEFEMIRASDENQQVITWRDIPAVPAESEWAFILEMDEKNAEEDDLCRFWSDRRRCYALKNPENASESQVKYAASLINAAEDAMYSENGYGADGKYYTEYVDIDSLARAYILQELIVNPLACNESMFLCVPENGGKIYTGPVWDFDLSSGEWENNLWCCCSSLAGGVCWFSAAFRHADFREKVAEIWNGFYATHDQKSLEAYINGIADSNSSSYMMDAYRWKKASYSPEATVSAYKNLCMRFAYAIGARSTVMDAGYSDKGAFIWYVFDDKNFCTQKTLLRAGDIIDVPSLEDAQASISDIYNSFGYSEDDFVCWNTSPDRSQQDIMPGDKLKIDDNAVVLYAIWNK